MALGSRLYPWHDVADVPQGTGIYAWYYRHLLTDYDIEQFKVRLSEVDPMGRKILAEEFIREHLFQPLAEEPYQVSMTGPLKPDYGGELQCKSAVSATLVERIAADPARLSALKTILADAVPEFASPIYIGMSVKLRSRLRRHKRLIEAYLASGQQPSTLEPESEDDQRDHSFARDVARRGLSVNRLEVAVRYINAPDNLHVDAENILNRMNHPICGRN